jgi:hypothetical protein
MVSIRLKEPIISLGVVTILTVLIGSININASDVWTLQNKWKQNTNLEIQGNSKWVIRSNRYYGSSGFVNICKENNNNHCLHIENGSLELGKIQDGWWSSAWRITPTYNGYVKIQNKWKSNQYLNIEYGALKSTPVYHGWWSYQWKKIKTENDTLDLQPSGDRFTRNNSQKTVTDKNKNLMWQDDSVVKRTKKKWLSNANYGKCSKESTSSSCTNTSGNTAMSYCSNLQLGDYDNWRLPSKIELESIVDKNRDNEPYIQKAFKNNPTDRYKFTWSSTVSSHIASWVVRFSNGKSQGYYKGANNSVRCVRDIENIDVPTNSKPTANAGADKTVTVNNSVTLYGSGSDNEGSVTFEWKKGDEVLGTGKTLTYMPTIVGTDILTLVVTDDDGATASDSVKINVKEDEGDCDPLTALFGGC